MDNRSWVDLIFDNMDKLLRKLPKVKVEEDWDRKREVIDTLLEWIYSLIIQLVVEDISGILHSQA